MNKPRMCPRCSARPVMRRGVDHCHSCHPRGPITPPPCRRCGSTEDYFAAGLCLRCHPGRPKTASSCPDCLAWGFYDQSRGYCLACRVFRKRHPDRLSCRVCARTVPLRDGFCRLCRRHAAMEDGGRHHDKLDLDGANRHGQQLFLGDLDRRIRLSVPMTSRDQYRRHKPAAPAFRWPLRPAAHCQLLLFDPTRDPKLTLPGRLPDPADTELVTALTAFARERGGQLGWNGLVLSKVCVTLRCAVAIQDTPGAAVKASALRSLSGPGFSILHASAVLTDAGFLDDDLPRDNLETWFAVSRWAFCSCSVRQSCLRSQALSQNGRSPSIRSLRFCSSAPSPRWRRALY